MASQAMQKIVKARAALLFSQPFFATLLLTKLHNLAEDKTCKTMWTDGRQIGFNPEYVNGLSADELKGVLCHEAMHVALGHHVRRQQRIHGRWNKACDYAVNDMILNSDMMLPGDVLYNPVYSGKASETIYNALPPDDDGEGEGEGNGGQGSDPGGCGEVRDMKNPDGSSMNESQKTEEGNGLRVSINLAANSARKAGKLPGFLDRAIKDILDPKLGWKEILREFLTKNIRSDYSWRKPNRRFLASGFMLPSLNNQSVGDIAIAVDTSGSISQQDIDQFSAEINDIFSQYNELSIDVYYCDTEASEPEHFESSDMPIVLHPTGGGGTDFRPVFKTLDSAGKEPEALIYFTDLCGEFPEEQPGYPVIWINTDSENAAPFGVTVSMK